MKKITLFIALFAFHCFMCFAQSITTVEGTVQITTPKGTLLLQPLHENAVRVRFFQGAQPQTPELIYTEKVSKPSFRTKENATTCKLIQKQLITLYNKQTQTLTFFNAQGEIILQESVQGRLLQQSTVQNEPTWIAEQHFVSPETEYLYGTGQFQDGYLNIRGLTRRLTQVNTQIAIPFILSNQGYGLLWNNYGLTDFNPAEQCITLHPKQEEETSITVNTTSTTGNKQETRFFRSFTATLSVPKEGTYGILLDVGQRMARKHFLAIDGKTLIDINNLWLPPTTSIQVHLTPGNHTLEVQGVKEDKPHLYLRKVTPETVFRSPVSQGIDYTVFAGKADDVIASYRQLTGQVPMLPQWALGYIHCRERYNTQAELLENAREFRKRQLPVDVIVQDWQWWGKYGWNAMVFDEDKYPDPAAMVKELHHMNLHLMLSVWSKIDRQSALGKEMAAKGYYIPGTDWIDFFHPDAAAFYWKNFSNRLLKPYQIDAWWQDATEPENDDLLNRKVNHGKTPGEVYRNVYPLLVNKTVYEGLRKDDPERRAMILTRSGFSGIQRYGAITWSGDVGNDWETLRRQLVGGLGQMATGLPWWTYDAGGFFRPGNQHSDAAYQERLIRWVEASTFLPLMRTHGYMSQTEPWRYGKQVEEITRKFLQLRYRLLPYIYSEAAWVSLKGSTLMRPLIFDFADDEKALQQEVAFMFGPSMLIHPITQGNVQEWCTYLPQHAAGWYDFWTGQHYAGGQSVTLPVTLDKIPVFVPAGSILPLGADKQYAAQHPQAPMDIQIYPGKDGTFTLYEDEGEHYHYEQQVYSTITFVWDDQKHQLTIGRNQGTYPGMSTQRVFRIITPKGEKTVTYRGKKLKVQLPK